MSDTKAFQIKLLCRHCRTKTKHLEVSHKTDQHLIHEYEDDPDSYPLGIDHEEHYVIVQCQNCEQHGLYYYKRDPNFELIGDGASDIFSQELYPAYRPEDYPSKYYPKAPKSVLSIHHELVQAYNAGLYSLAAMGVRMLIEGVCRDKGITDRSLWGKIDRLVEQGFLSRIQGEVLHELRQHGNEAAHKLAQPSRTQLKAYLQILDTTLETVYEYPSLKINLEAKRNKRKGSASA